MELIEQADSLGGSVAAIDEGFFQEEIGRSAYEHQLRVESGATIVVGVNRFADSNENISIPAPDYSALEADQVTSLAGLRKSREDKAVRSSLDALAGCASELMRNEARPEVMPAIIDAVRARCTIGEISGSLLEVWGSYSPSVGARN
jgi:methylmalonyl-CoA mutase N-terminal domain/subunit